MKYYLSVITAQQRPALLPNLSQLVAQTLFFLLFSTQKRFSGRFLTPSFFDDGFTTGIRVVCQSLPAHLLVIFHFRLSEAIRRGIDWTPLYGTRRQLGTPKVEKEYQPWTKISSPRTWLWARVLQPARTAPPRPPPSCSFSATRLDDYKTTPGPHPLLLLELFTDPTFHHFTSCEGETSSLLYLRYKRIRGHRQDPHWKDVDLCTLDTARFPLRLLATRGLEDSW